MKAKFDIVNVTDDIVFLQDTGGPKSITNDAEAVFRWVKLHFPGKRVMYRDEYGEQCELYMYDSEIVFIPQD